MPSPQNTSATEAIKPDPTPVPLWLKPLAIALTLLLCGYQYLRASATFADTAAALGGALTPLILGLLVVLLFQIGKRFRTGRARWQIFLAAQAVMLVSAISTILTTAASA